jgi:hypothetical protein
LERLLEQPHLLSQAGCVARQQMAEQHSWDKHLDCYEDLFTALTSQRLVASAVPLHP